MYSNGKRVDIEINFNLNDNYGDQAHVYYGADSYRDAYNMEFFSDITVASNYVTIDLNRNELKIGMEFDCMQRLFALIELANIQFLSVPLFFCVFTNVDYDTYKYFNCQTRIDEAHSSCYHVAQDVIDDDCGDSNSNNAYQFTQKQEGCLVNAQQQQKKQSHKNAIKKKENGEQSHKFLLLVFRLYLILYQKMMLHHQVHYKKLCR